MFFDDSLLKLLFSTIGNVISRAAQQLSARQLRASAVADGIAQHVMFSCNVVRNSSPEAQQPKQADSRGVCEARGK